MWSMVIVVRAIHFSSSLPLSYLWASGGSIFVTVQLGSLDYMLEGAVIEFLVVTLFPLKRLMHCIKPYEYLRYLLCYLEQKYSNSKREYMIKKISIQLFWVDLSTH